MFAIGFLKTRTGSDRLDNHHIHCHQQNEGYNSIYCNTKPEMNDTEKTSYSIASTHTIDISAGEDVCKIMAADLL